MRGAAASRARSVGVSPRRASALPARAARRSPAAGVSMVGGSLNDLLANNLEWSKHMTADDPNYFQNLVAMQQPDYLWIGCSDSRVPANVIVGLPPGAIFVHRNIANVVAHTDFNVLSVIEYAVKVLKVRHILVVGHDNCGGVKASMGDERVGLVDNWLTHIRDVRRRHAVQLSTIDDFDARMDRLVQLNVLEQVHNVCSTTTVQSAWNDGQPLSVHGWIYRLSDGLIRDLGFRVDGPEGIDSVYRTVAPRPPAGKGVAAEV